MKLNKIKFKKYKLPITVGASFFLITAATVATVVPIVLKNQATKWKAEYALKDGYSSEEANAHGIAKTADFNSITKLLNSSKKINTTTLVKSLKMVLQMYRGGYFDFSKTTLLFQSSKVQYQELMDFIDHANCSQLDDFAHQFNKVIFKKAFAYKFREILSLQTLVKKIPQKGFDSLKDAIHKTLIQDGIDDLYNDFNFFAQGNRDWTKSMSDILSKEDFTKFITYDDINGQQHSIDETKTIINNLNSEQDLATFLLSGPQEAIFNLPLSDKYLVKYSEVVNKTISPIYEDYQIGDIKINYGNWDPVFGMNTSLYDYNEFARYMAFDNIISPMLVDMYGKWNNSDWAKFPWGNSKSAREDMDKHSELFPLSISLEDIFNYQSSQSEMFGASIPLNTNLNYTNKLKESQVKGRGLTMFTQMNNVREAFTRNYYPNITDEYQNDWSYMKTYLAWGGMFTFPSPEEVDAAHKNGVQAIGTIFSRGNSTLEERLMAMTEGDKNVFVNNLIQILKDRGIDGMFWNAEVAGWDEDSRGRINYPAEMAQLDFLKTLDLKFRENGLIFLKYSNYDVELPRNNDQIKQYIEEAYMLDYPNYEGKNYDDYLDENGDALLDADGLPLGGDVSAFTGTHSPMRDDTMNPSSGLWTVNHFDKDLSFYDEEFGLGAGKNIFTGFDDKYDLDYGMDSGLIGRMQFAKEHPDYNVIQMGWDNKDPDWSGPDMYIQREFAEMQKLKKLSPSEFEKVIDEVNDNNWPNTYSTNQADYDFDHYYGDYSLFSSNEFSYSFGKDKNGLSLGYDALTPLFSSHGAWGGVTYDSFSENAHVNKYAVASGTASSGTSGAWLANGQDPRATTGAMSDYFQEHSTLNNNSFFTSFEGGYGHYFNINSQHVAGFGDWGNTAAQDIMPTYRYIIDKYDAAGELVDDSVNNYVKRDIEAHIIDADDAYFGNNVLSYTGTLSANESFVNKLYVSNVTTPKDFSLVVKANNQADFALTVWRNDQNNFEEIKPSQTTTMNNGYIKLTFNNVQASSTSRISSFGIKVKNTSSSNLNLESIKVDGLGYKTNNISETDNHDIVNVVATSNNTITDGVNIKFEDPGFDENTRYFVYDSNGKFVTFAPTEYFHVPAAGTYTIKMFNNEGKSLGEKNITLSKATRWA